MDEDRSQDTPIRIIAILIVVLLLVLVLYMIFGRRKGYMLAVASRPIGAVMRDGTYQSASNLAAHGIYPP